MKNSLLLHAAIIVAGAAGPAFAAEDATEAKDTADIIVTADRLAGGQITREADLGLLGSGRIFDTPFSILSYSEEFIRDLQIRRVSDVLQLDPSVALIEPVFGTTEAFNVRGFPNRYGDTLGIDGLFGLSPGGRNGGVEAMENVQLLKGPSALINGVAPFGGTGGSVNLVTKRAGDKPITRFTASYLSEEILGGHIDIGRRYGANGELGIRTNISYRRGDTPIPENTIERFVGSLALDYRGERFRAYAHFLYNVQDDRGFQDAIYVITPGIEIPDAPKGDTRFGPTNTRIDDRTTVVHGGFEYDISDAITLSAAHGRSRFREFIVGYDLFELLDTEGNTTAYGYEYPNEKDRKVTNVTLRGKFNTGGVSHNMSLGGSSIIVRNGRNYFESQFITVNIFDGSNAAGPPITVIGVEAVTDERQKLRSVAVSDTMGFFDDRVLFTAGVRYQDMRILELDGDTVLNEYDESAYTPAFALVVKPTERISLYANYIEALSQGPTAPDNLPIENPGQVFAPYRAKQYEAGIKWDLGGFGVTGAIFQIAQPSAFIRDNVFGVFGEQRHRGLELSAFGAPTRDLRVVAGLAYIDAKIVGGPDDGQTGVGVPELAFRLNAEWDIAAVPGLTLTGGILGNTSSYIDTANQQKLPGYVIGKLGAQYRLQGDVPLTLRLSVDNITNKGYWVSNQYLTLGSPRLISFSAQFDF